MTISPNIIGTEGFKKEVTIFVVSVLEISRLFIWNLIIVEREHMTSIGVFKSILDIKFPYDVETQLSEFSKTPKFDESH